MTAALTLSATFALVADADAQRRGYYSSDPNVTVDLSVLGGPGNEPVVTRPLPAPGAAPSGASSIVRSPDGLLFPPPNSPESRLTGRYATMAPAPQLTPPAKTSPARSASAPASRLNVPAPAAMPKAVEPAPMPKAAAPAPMPKAPEPAPKAPEPKMAAASTAAATATRSASAPAAPVPPPPTVPEPAAAPKPPMAAPEPAASDSMAKADTAKADSAPAAAAPVETAARTTEPAATTSASAPDDLVRILFDDGSAKLPDGARSELQSLVTKLGNDDTLRVQLEAYAAGTGDTASQARRLSLSRALAVRSFLIDQGVRSTRMDVRALGNKQTDPPGPADRVDARLVTR